MRPPIKLSIAAGLALLLLACGGDGPVKVEVGLAEWRITPAVTALAPGRVTFTARNEGAREHELLIVKTDLPLNQLPLAEGRIDESRLHVVGRIDAIAPGTVAETTVGLSPGKYAFVCNRLETATPRISHYDQGMVAGFTVAQ
jgi:uncharacterized cupredoxin-like copper-binding protein